MSVRFVACVTRYSRGAKNRCDLKYNTGFITIFFRCIIAKNYPNWPSVDKVFGKIKRVQFFLKHSVVPMNQAPGLYAGRSVCPGPGFYPNFYCMYGKCVHIQWIILMNWTRTSPFITCVVFSHRNWLVFVIVTIIMLTYLASCDSCIRIIAFVLCLN